ncbi:MAG: hypothetical protein ACO3QC_14185, partial [Phycisphaerales bacterium]
PAAAAQVAAPAPAPAPAASSTAATAEPTDASSDLVDPIAAPPAGPGLITRLMRRVSGFMALLATLPLRILSLPMRVLPESARTVVGIAAITLAFWTPLAWWYATTQAKAPGVGRVNLVEREAPAASEGEAKESAEHAGSKESSHAAAPAAHGSSGH